MKEKPEYFISYNYLNDRIVLCVGQRNKASKYYLLNFLHKKRLSKKEYRYGGISEMVSVHGLNHSPTNHNLDWHKGKCSIEFLSFKQFNNLAHPYTEVFNVLRKTKLFSSHQG